MAPAALRSRSVPFVVLALIMIVDVVRGAWPDLVFFLVAFVLAAGQTRSARTPALALRGPPPRALLAAGAGLAWVILALAPRHGAVAGVVVGTLGVVTGVVAALGGWPAAGVGTAPARPGGPAFCRAVLAWAAIIVVAGVWELTAYLTWRFGVLADGVMPSISDVLDPLLDTGVGKAVFALVWLAGGAGLLMRAWVPRGGGPGGRRGGAGAGAPTAPAGEAPCA